MNENKKLELPDWLNVVAVFDTETTGLVLNESRIVTAAIHLVESSGAVRPDGKDWLINPGVPIPPEATRVHKIDDAKAATGLDTAVGVAQIVETIQDLFAKGIPVVAYNASYDFSILHHEAIRHGIEPVSFGFVIDPLVIDKTIDKYRKGKRTLESVAERYNVPLLNAHTAADDAIAAGHVGFAVLRYFLGHPKPVTPFPASLSQLHDLQVKWADEIEASYAAWRQQEMPNYKPKFGWPVKND